MDRKPERAVHAKVRDTKKKKREKERKTKKKRKNLRLARPILFQSKWFGKHLMIKDIKPSCISAVEGFAASQIFWYRMKDDSRPEQS